MEAVQQGQNSEAVTLDTVPTPPTKLPPMLTQYLQYKAEYPDAVLLFQVGDFYEIFFEDAVLVSRTLNLTLTTRDKNNPNPVPMCGVPIGVVDGYVERLVSGGLSVALVAQVGEVTGKGMVTRKLERMVTPGIRLLNNNQGSASSPAVAALYPVSFEEVVVAISNVASGRIEVLENININTIAAELRKFELGEVVLPSVASGKRLDRRLGWVREIELVVGVTGLKFRPERLGATEHRIHSVSGFTALAPGAQRSVRLLVDYIDEVTVSGKIPIRTVTARQSDQHLTIDAMTRRNLELLRNTKDGSIEGTLLQYLDRTVTPGGARLMRQWIAEPLRQKNEICERLGAVRAFVAMPHVVDALRKELAYVPDIERIAARIELGVVGPRELGALRDAVLKAPSLASHLTTVLLPTGRERAFLTPVEAIINKERDWGMLLGRALSDEVPVTLGDVEVIRRGFDSELDRLRNLKANGAGVIAELESRERSNTGINSLKIRYNNLLGFFIEVTKANRDRVPAEYIARQHTTTSERYTTTELRALESEVLGADAAVRACESKLFSALKIEMLSVVEEIRSLASALSTVDTVVALAYVAVQHDLIEPEINDDSSLVIDQGRHPVIAELLAGRFVPNSLDLKDGGKRCIILTGPNMGGKSTYLRQAALIVIMAQLGSFVPAKRALIGVVDQVFARLGASDNLADGESTFMVEMREVAHIVQNATTKSLVLIDEVGRGTATLDGVSLAQAILEWLLTKVEARTLCATHFHELTSLATRFSAVENLSVGSVDREGEVFFTHEIRSGAANRSYGLEVARLTGLPRGLLDRAWELLRTHEAVLGAEQRRTGVQLALFPNTPLKTEVIKTVIQEPADYSVLKELAQMVRAANPDELTPRGALDFVFQLTEYAQQSKK